MQFKMSRPESQFELFTLSLLLRLFADLFASAGFIGLRAAGTLRKENMTIWQYSHYFEESNLVNVAALLGCCWAGWWMHGQWYLWMVLIKRLKCVWKNLGTYQWKLLKKHFWQIHAFTIRPTPKWNVIDYYWEEKLWIHFHLIAATWLVWCVLAVLGWSCCLEQEKSK